MPDFKDLTQRKRRWCFTEFKLDKIDPTNPYPNVGHTYILAGLETCPDTGRLHWQGYMEFKNAKTGTAIKKKCSKSMHLEWCYGSQKSNKDYCGKEKKDWFEYGDPFAQGQRTDLEGHAKQLLDGMSLEDFILEHPTVYASYRNGIKDIAGIAMKQRSKAFRRVQVDVYWGAAGAGKTRKAVEDNPDHFILPCGEDRVWFDGYNGEKCLILDDFYGGIKYGLLLRLLDGYQLRLPTKGSFTYALWNKVIITSNKPPTEWYQRGFTDALQRRVTNVIQM